MSKMADLHLQLLDIRNKIAQQAALATMALATIDLRAADLILKEINRKLTDVVEEIDELLA